jgi:hypothetical protein
MPSRADKWVWVVAIWSAFAPGILMALGRSGVIGPNPGTFFALGMMAMLAIVGGIYAGREALKISWRQTRLR